MAETADLLLLVQSVGSHLHTSETNSLATSLIEGLFRAYLTETIS
jgi:hypothetical protein